MTFLDRWNLRGRSRTVLLADGGDGLWAVVPIRAWDRALSHLRSPALDAQLAAGESTTTNRLRAVRAATLVAPATRRQLALGWQGVLRRQRSVVPVRRSEVLAAVDEIHQLVRALRAEEPVAPRGVAIAALLLTDGTGPLYNAGNPLPVREEIRSALHHLQPDWAPNR